MSNSCPRCLVQRLRGRADEPGALACRECHGVWLTAAAVHGVIPASLGPLSGLPAVGTGHAALRCPECDDPLVQRAIFGVEVDVCDAHGVWFDHREVEHIRAAARHEAGDRTVVDAASVDTRTGPGPRKTRIATPRDDALESTMVVAEVALTGVDVAAATADAVDLGAGVEAAGGVLEALGGLFEGIFG